MNNKYIEAAGYLFEDLCRILAGLIGFIGIAVLVVLAFVFLWWLILPILGLAFCGWCLKFAFDV